MRSSDRWRLRLTRTSWIAGVWALTGVAAACHSQPEAESARRAEVGEQLPDWRGALLTGDSISVADLGAPVLVNLWATWCPPCRDEMPFLQELHERYGGEGLRIVGISSDGPRDLEAVRRFVAETGLEFDIALDPSGATLDLFRVFGLPATYVADADGRIVLLRRGPVSASDTELVTTIESLLES